MHNGVTDSPHQKLLQLRPEKAEVSRTATTIGLDVRLGMGSSRIHLGSRSRLTRSVSMRRNTTPPTTGHASLTVGRTVSAVTYELHAKSGRGSTTGTPEHMADAFRKREAVLARDGEPPLRISFVGYCAGSDTAYFEPEPR